MTGGENKLPPVGLMLFSVGDTALVGGVVAVVAVVVGVVVDGPLFSLVAQPAATAPIATTAAAPPAIAITRRPKRFKLTIHILSVVSTLPTDHQIPSLRAAFALSGPPNGRDLRSSSRLVPRHIA